jgi:hypothetical protein
LSDVHTPASPATRKFPRLKGLRPDSPGTIVVTRPVLGSNATMPFAMVTGAAGLGLPLGPPELFPCVAAWLCPGAGPGRPG